MSTSIIKIPVVFKWVKGGVLCYLSKQSSRSWSPNSVLIDLALIYNKNKEMLRIAKGNDTFEQWNDQNSQKFGFIPLADFNIPVQDKNVSLDVSHLQRHEIVKNSGKHNFMGPQILVPSQLNIEKWEEVLKGYWDRQLIYLLKYGFPLDFNQEAGSKSTLQNHKSATQFPEQVEKYITDELGHNALLGPFEEPPIDGLHISPLLSRPKDCVQNRRIIMDLSFPPLFSVNDSIQNNVYLETPFLLTLSTVDDIVKNNVSLGRGSHIFKLILAGRSGI